MTTVFISRSNNAFLLQQLQKEEMTGPNWQRQSSSWKLPWRGTQSQLVLQQHLTLCMYVSRCACFCVYVCMHVCILWQTHSHTRTNINIFYICTLHIWLCPSPGRRKSFLRRLRVVWGWGGYVTNIWGGEDWEVITSQYQKKSVASVLCYFVSGYCCNVLQCVAVCCSVLQCMTVLKKEEERNSGTKGYFPTKQQHFIHILRFSLQYFTPTKNTQTKVHTKTKPTLTHRCTILLNSHFTVTPEDTK